MNKVVCYTCITGGYDRLQDPVFVSPNIDYVCFSDTPVMSNVWQVRQIPSDVRGLSPVKQQRTVKICPHRYLPEYDVSIWVDGNILVKGDLNKMISEYDLTETPLYTRIHPGRNCIYEEADAIMLFGKDRPEKVKPIIDRYRAEGYPEHIGLAETCVLLRSHNDRKCIAFDNAWATELLLNSHRDQLSFNYVAWKRRFMVGYMTKQFKIQQNEYFEIRKHG